MDNKTAVAIGFEVFCDFVPFTDILSDVVLLISVWPRTGVIAPDDVNGCTERALWYLALSFTVIGTLVDLFPEMLLLSEVILHPQVLSSYPSLKRLFFLIFSDGKPVVVFAAKDYHKRDLDAPMQAIKESLRRRLSSIATTLFMRDGCGEEYPRWTYAGIVGILVGGEVLTAIGAFLFLRIEFGWPALISLLASLFALALSLRSHMRNVGEKELHLYNQTVDSEEGGTLLEFLLPGPVTLVRYLLAVPVWPMMIVYAEVAQFWPFKHLDEGDFSLPWSTESMWAYPIDWLRIDSPSLGSSDNPTPLSFLQWVIVPHMVFTLAAAAFTAVVGTGKLLHFYLGHQQNFWDRHSWREYFSSQESPFHVWSLRLQSTFGLGFTIWVAMEIRRLGVFSAALTVLVVMGYKQGECMEQEWAFVFAVAAWWGVMLIGHAARIKNIFQPRARETGPNRRAAHW